MLACTAQSSFGRKDFPEPLKQLISANEEAEENLRAAADAVRDTGLRAQFSSVAQQRGAFAAELREASGRLGARVGTASASLTHTIRRAWSRMWSATMPADDQLALEEAEAVEETTVNRYRDVLRGEAGKSLPQEVRTLHREAIPERPPGLRPHQLHALPRAGGNAPGIMQVR